MPLTIGGLGPRSDHRDAVFVNAGPVDEAAALYALAKAGEALARNIRRAGPDTGALIALQRGEKQRRRYSGGYRLKITSYLSGNCHCSRRHAEAEFLK